MGFFIDERANEQQRTAFADDFRGQARWPAGFAALSPKCAASNLSQSRLKSRATLRSGGPRSQVELSAGGTLTGRPRRRQTSSADQSTGRRSALARFATWAVGRNSSERIRFNQAAKIGRASTFRSLERARFCVAEGLSCPSHPQAIARLSWLRPAEPLGRMRSAFGFAHRTHRRRLVADDLPAVSMSMPWVLRSAGHGGRRNDRHGHGGMAASEWSIGGAIIFAAVWTVMMAGDDAAGRSTNGAESSLGSGDMEKMQPSPPGSSLPLYPRLARWGSCICCRAGGQRYRNKPRVNRA